MLGTTRSWFPLFLAAGLAAGCSASNGNGDGCKANLLPGDLVVSEIMANPTGTDEGWEWIELYNPTSSAIDLEGVQISAARADGTSEKIHAMRSIRIEPAAYLVLGGVLDEIAPGWVDYGYGADLGSLLNSGGKVGVSCGATVVDEVVYEEGDEGHARGFDGALVPDAIANNNQGDWCDQQVPFDTDAWGTPGQANEACEPDIPPTQCKENDAIRDIVPPQPGDLVITEFMANPAAVGDTAGEWFEVYVGAEVDINGLEAGKVPGDVDVKVSSLDCIRVPAGTHLLFARNDNPAENGGLPPVDVVIGFGLTNGGDTLFVGYGGNVFDSIGFTTSSDGASTSLDPTMTTAQDNDDPDVWCQVSETYGSGDRGTPGAPNPSCGIVPEGQCYEGANLRDKVPPAPGDLVISEFMANPERVGDAMGEWFEVYVAAEVDLNGLQVGRDPLDPDLVLPEGDCLHVAAGGYVLFARELDPVLNGGLDPVDFEIGFGLVNTGGALFVGLDGTVLDAISWSSVTAGAATSLHADHLDPIANDDPGNWCPAVSPYGLGDLGTPRAANPVCP